MSTLVRWNPGRDFWAMRNMMSRLLDDFNGGMVGPAEWAERHSWALPLDVTESDDVYDVKASIPGVNVDDIEITLEDNVLTIKGEVQEEQSSEKGRWHIRERRFGSFSRSISLPAQVDANAIEASYEKGVLHLTLPKAEIAKPKRIAIKGKGGKTVIEAKSS